MVKITLAVVLFAIAGCASLSPEQVARWHARTVQVCVANEAAARGNLQGGEFDRGSSRLFDVMEGRVECERFERPMSANVELFLRSNGGGMAGPVRVTASVPFRPGGCWVWRVMNNGSVNNLLECRPRDFVNVQAAFRDGQVAGEFWGGFTQCRSIPASFLNITPGVIPPGREEMVRVHEAKHREQMRRFGSCAAWRAAIDALPQVRIDHEAEAHCEAALHEYRRGAHPSLLLAMLEQASWFSWYFWRGDTGPALEAIARFCVR